MTVSKTKSKTVLSREVFHTDPTDYNLANQGVAKIHYPPSSEGIKTLRGELETFVCDGIFKSLFPLCGYSFCSDIPIANGNSRIYGSIPIAIRNFVFSGSRLGSYLEVTIEANRKRY